MFGFLKSADGTFSLTKIAGTIGFLAGLVLTIPTAGVALPAGLLVGAKVAAAITVAMGANGVRNAIDAKK